jgi:hypothetical protein
VINAAISYYNLGHTFEEAARLTNKRFKKKASKSSVSNWVKETEKICTYRKIRDAGKNYGKDLIYSKVFRHKDLSYNFKYHGHKLDRLCWNDEFVRLRRYIKKFEQGCPKFFNDIPERCSQTRIKVNKLTRTKYNNACRLVELALLGCRNNRERHDRVEDFMLINDSCTIAVEVPVWLYEKSLGTRMNGHIDVLQVRNNKIFVLDYKPGAEKENIEKVKSQLYWYATGLSFRTKIPLRFFRCAWFDENVYYEFDPREAKWEIGY